MVKAPQTGRVRKARGKAESDGGQAMGYARPGTYEELRAVLSSGTLHLPKRLRQVAIFLWQHPSDVALGTISSVAEQAGVQPSTLVRFAQTFGYSGFSDFQDIFKQHLRATWPERRSRADHAGKADTKAGLHYLEGLFAASRTSLDRIAENVSAARFERMIDILTAGELIHVIGSKRAFPVAAYISLTLSQQGVRNVLVDNIGSTAFDHVGCLSARDAVLAISFSPYNSITPDLVAVARERGGRIASITDSTFSPLVKLSDAWIEVIESDFAGFRSLAATLAIGMGLAQAIAARGSA